MFIPIIALAFAIQKETDPWDLKPTADPKTKLTWDVKIEAQAGGQDHHAAFKFTRVLKSDDAKKTVVTFGWDHLEVDDQDGQEVPPWDAVVGARSEILKMDGDTDDSYRRMLAPLLFIYPEKPVAIGDKYTFDAKPSVKGETITYAYEVKKSDTINGSPTLVIGTKFTEAGADGSTGDGTWWLSKTGKIVKFEIKVKNWVVPMAGGGPVDATLKGQAL